MFNRGAYTTIGVVCEQKTLFPHLNGASCHSHTHAHYLFLVLWDDWVRRGGAEN